MENNSGIKIIWLPNYQLILSNTHSLHIYWNLFKPFYGILEIVFEHGLISQFQVKFSRAEHINEEGDDAFL